ncbi:MAG: hypothetical protein HQM06_09900 [Magnetococcales bacterium]|nr:hypothetical protein [Magnetococcales bacterium]
MNESVLQIIPTSGEWFAVTDLPPEGEELFETVTEPVACFALIENRGVQSVAGIVPDGTVFLLGDSSVTFCRKEGLEQAKNSRKSNFKLWTEVER